MHAVCVACVVFGQSRCRAAFCTISTFPALALAPLRSCRPAYPTHPARPLILLTHLLQARVPGGAHAGGLLLQRQGGGPPLGRWRAPPQPPRFYWAQPGQGGSERQLPRLPGQPRPRRLTGWTASSGPPPNPAWLSMADLLLVHTGRRQRYRWQAAAVNPKAARRFAARRLRCPAQFAAVAFAVATACWGMLPPQLAVYTVIGYTVQQGGTSITPEVSLEKVM